jgi:cytochrome oxidase assembly protein ShyY1
MLRLLLRPKFVLFHLVCLGAIVAMANLSIWQFHRLDQRREFNTRVEDRSTLSVADVTTLDMSDPPALEWRRIGAAGTYRPDDQVLILNRSQGGQAGVNVVTPLQLANGRSILVVRGFLPLGTDVPAPPTGAVAVVGFARLSDVEYSTTLSTGSGRRREFFRLDIDRIGEQVAGPLEPVVVYAQVSEPAEDPALRPVPLPELSQGPHLSYAIQWILFSIAVAVGWVLAVRRSVHAARRVSEPTRSQPFA